MSTTLVIIGLVVVYGPVCVIIGINLNRANAKKKLGELEQAADEAGKKALGWAKNALGIK